MMGNKYVAILIKPLATEKQEKLKKKKKLESILLDVLNRYHVEFVKNQKDDGYVCHMGLQPDCMDVIAYCFMRMHPYEALYTLGMSVSQNSESKAKEDAYQQAKTALKQLGKMRKRRDYRELYIKVALPSENKALETALNTIVLLDCDLQNHWTQKQRDIVFFGYFEEKNQKETAEYFKVSQPNVHQVLKKANYALYRDIRKSYKQIFEQITVVPKMSKKG